MFQTETQARVSTSVQAAERNLADHLNQSVRRLRQSTTFAEIAAVLCDAATPFAAGIAVFQLLDGELQLERVRGGVIGKSATWRIPLEQGAAFRNAVESREPVIALCSPGELTPALVDLLSPAPDEKAYLFPLTAGAAVAGILLALGNVESAALELLAQTAEAVLEAREKSRRLQPAMAPAGLIAIAPAAPSADSNAPSWESLSAAERQVHLRAQRFARVQVAEIRLYQAEAVKAGRARGDLYDALREIIDEARETFRRDFAGSATAMVDYLHLELLRTLANDNPQWLGPHYPGPLILHEPA